MSTFCILCSRIVSYFMKTLMFKCFVFGGASKHYVFYNLVVYDNRDCGIFMKFYVDFHTYIIAKLIVLWSLFLLPHSFKLITEEIMFNI